MKPIAYFKIVVGSLDAPGGRVEMRRATAAGAEVLQRVLATANLSQPVSIERPDGVLSSRLIVFAIPSPAPEEPTK